MRSLAFIFACLACAGHGHRAQILVERKDEAASKGIDSSKPATDAGVASYGTLSHSLAQVAQSDAFNPTAAWQIQRPNVPARPSRHLGMRNRNLAKGSMAPSGKQVQMMETQSPTAFRPIDSQSVQMPQEKIVQGSVHHESSARASANSLSKGRLASLVLCLALSGAVPALALTRQRTIWWPRRSSHSKRAPGPVLTAAVADAGSSSGASVSSSIINLAKNIVGSGVLSLSAGIAAFSAAGAGVWPAMVVMLGLGAVSAYSFALIARVGDEVGASSYGDVWAKTFGEGTAVIPSLTVAFMTVAAGLSYSIILGDSFASIASLAGLPAILCASNTWIIGLSACLLLPLSLMRDLSSLAIGSIIGTAGTIYTALFMCLRFIDRSYAAGGKFHEVIAENARPFFSPPTAARPLLNPAIFVLISMLASSFLAHYNAPKYFKELAEPKDGSSKSKSFNIVVGGAFGLAALLSALIMAGGFLTFGGASQGFILNSYATSDPLAFLARLGISLSIIFSYPLNFLGLREGVLNILKLDGGKNKIHITSTLILLCGMNGLSLVLKDLGLVCAVGGAIMGSALVYIFPALMFIQATRMKTKADGKQPAARLREMYANYGLVGLGAVLAVIGVIMSLKSA